MEWTLSWRELLIAVVLAVIIYLLESALFARRRSPADLRRQVERLEADVAALRAALAKMEPRPPGLQGRSDDTEPQSPYDYAVECARQGMMAPEIASRCGISRDEATLIVTMQRRRSGG